MTKPREYSAAQQGAALDEMIDRSLKNPLRTVDPDADAFFRDKIRHVLLKDEHILEFCARTGLGPAQAQLMTPQEISDFCDNAMAREANTEASNASWNPKRTIPKHFVI